MVEHKIERYRNGNKCYELYYLNDKWHNEDGPAFIKYYENGNICYETYCINGTRHRIDGPAVTYYYKNGKIEYEEYYFDGYKISAEKIYTITNELCISNKFQEWTNEHKLMFGLHIMSKAENGRT